jgi:SAM-dependent methyltransferase
MSLEVPVAKAEESSRRFWEWCNAEGGMPEHYPDEEVVRFLMRHKGRSFRVLDLGSGSGKNTGVILDLGFEAVCADYSQPGLDYTLARFKGRNLTANFVDFTKQPLPYADGAFDLIIAIQVFDHLLAAQARVLVKEAARVLKPGGQMLATLMTTNTTRKSRIGDPLHGEENTMLVSSGNSAGEIHRLSRPEQSEAFFNGLSLVLKQSFVITQHYEQSAETAEARYFLLEKSGN